MAGKTQGATTLLHLTKNRWDLSMKKSFLVLSLLICLLTTGCLRMTEFALGNAFSAMGPGTSCSMDSDAKYFHGTQLCWDERDSALLPVAVLDLPFEFAIDLLVLPAQLAHAVKMKRNKDRQDFMNRLSLIQLAERDFKEEFLRRLRDEKGYIDSRRLMEDLVAPNHFHGRWRRALKYIEIVIDYSPSFAWIYFTNPKCINSFFITKSLIDKGIDIRKIPLECSVFCVLAWGTIGVEHYERVKYLLEHGGNPNGLPANKELLFPEKAYGKSALDIAKDAYDTYCQQYTESPNPHMLKLKETTEKLVKLLESHGAKSFSDLYPRPYSRRW